MPVNSSIQLAFDRLLLPASITRQTFILSGDETPTITYDPVARVVTINPFPALMVGQPYELEIATPQNASDPNGLRAIDGATLDPKTANVIAFVVGPPSPSVPAPPSVDFCNDVFNGVFTSCIGSGCHQAPIGAEGPFPAEGLVLTTVPGIQQTAIGRVAHESDTGPNALPLPPGLHFGINMSIIDPGNGGGGNPGNSWLMYKMLMAIPVRGWPSCEDGPAITDGGADAEDAGAAEDSASEDATTADASAEAGSQDAGAEGGSQDATAEIGAPSAASTTPYAVCPQPLSSTERAALSNLIQGREMPFPSTVSTSVSTGISVSGMEAVSFWIAQGAPIPSGGCP